MADANLPANHARPSIRPVRDRPALAAFPLMVLLAGGNAVGVKVATDELDPFWAIGRV
jgi:hypothetical protein